MEPYQFQVTPLDEQPNTFRQRQVRRVIYGLAAIAGIFIVAGSIWFFWGRSPSFTEKNISLTVEADEEIPSGEKVSYVVKFRNDNPQALKDVRLVFFYPTDSVVIKDGKSAPFLTEEVKIGMVEPGGQGSHEFPAYLVGDRGEVKKAVARLVFTPEQVRSSFEKEVALSTTISSQDVSLTLVAPPNAVSGQPISYFLDYRNESSKDLADLKIRFKYPDGFTPTKFDPAPVSGNNLWDLKLVKAGEGKRIVIDGILRGVERESKPVEVVLQRIVDGIEIDYQKADSMTMISTPLLATEVTVNGQSGNSTAQLGELLSYQIKFTNNSEVDILGLTIIAKLEGSMYELGNLKTNTGFFDAGAKTVTWNASSSPLLNRLAPQQYGVVDFTVSLKSTFPSSGLGAKDFVVKTTVKADTPTVPPGFFSDRLTAQAEATTKIKSLPAFEQTAQYQAEGWEASGPIPPKSGSKTVYTIVWRMSNTSGDVLKTRMKGVLPTGVNWENKTRVSGQQPLPTYKSTSREVIWDIGVLPAGTGSTTPKYEAWFQVSVTPTINQAGSFLQFVKDLTLEGEDGVTKQAFVLKGRDVGSNDLTDRPNQGTVVP
ncbi:MAG: hypothetical protein Q7S32_00205 [bacterium]|nr:hypothetical protein [bacterium]